MLDRIVQYLAPRYAVRRQLARAQLAGLARARAYYDGATTGRRAAGWRTVATDANTEVRLGGARLRDVARDMVRNNSYAARGKAVICSNTVGSGIIPSIEARRKGTRDRLENLLREHFDTPACDATGRMDLYGLQSLVMGTVVESGECLVRFRPRRAADGLPLPFQLQVMEPDYLDTMVDGEQPNGNVAVQGIEFDRIGRVRAYHLFSEHPGATSRRTFSPRSTPVPAELVAHIYRVDRPGQARGVSWFAPVILRLRDFSDFADAQLMRQKIAACFAAFVTADPMETTDPEESDSGFPLEAFEPGMIERLAPGENIEFATPPPVGEYDQYGRATLREIAAGLGVSYEAMSGDLSKVNFSSGRMGWLEFQRSIDAWRDQILVPQLLMPLGSTFLNYARIIGALSANDVARVKWTPPRREMISPRDEVPFAMSMVRAGFASRSEVIRKLGYDPEVVDAEIKADNQRADQLELVFDTDPRQRTSAGNPVTAGGTDAAAGSEPAANDDKRGIN